DVDITKSTSTATVNAGGTASFTVTLTNDGTGTATGVSFSDALPAGLSGDVSWSISSQDGSAFSISGATGSQHLVLSPTRLTASESHTVTVTATVLADDTAPEASAGAFSGTLVNSASITAANETTTEQNQSATATVNLTAPDVDITKSTSTATVNAGGTASFTVTLTNDGTGTATGVSFSDALPAGFATDVSWSISPQDGSTFRSIRG